MMATPITVTGATFLPGAPVVLFSTHNFGSGVEAQHGREYDVAPDGRFLVNTLLSETAALIMLPMNWNPQTKRWPARPDRCWTFRIESR